jgi:acyl-CoA synthetase (AMP-forming)/AMP-acid ligase II
MNLAGLLRDNAARLPDKVAVDAPEGLHTYAAVWARTQALMQWLQAQGLQPGQRVAGALRDTTDHLLLHFAVAGLGAVWVPLDHRWSAAEKAAAIAAFAASHVIAVDPPAQWPGPEAGFAGSSAVSSAMGSAMAAAGVEVPLAAGDDTPWLISLSSGSTGRPKGALVTHTQMHERFISQWTTLGFSAADRFALVSPLCFGAGRSFGMAFLAVGGTVVLRPPPLSPEQLVLAINTSASTAVFLVPTLMRRLLALPGEGQLFPGLRRLLVSGEPFFPSEVAQFRARLSENLIGYYASSEGGGISVLQPAEFLTHPDSVGRASHGVELELVDEDGRVVAVGETGLVRYRGPGCARDFLDENGQPAASDAAGWFVPGDLGTCDADGYLRLVGRAKDMILRAGVNVYPAEVERVLREHAAVADVGVVGEPSASHGEQVVAFVALQSAAGIEGNGVGDGVGDDSLACSAEQLLAHCRERLASYKVPARIVFLPALPKAGMGKTDKKALRALLATVS